VSSRKFLDRIAARTQALLAALLLTACATPAVEDPDTVAAFASPEAASGYTEKPGWLASKFMVAAANPLASDAGYDMLRQGGSAVDAAIATQLVLGLVEPQSSGLGGGAFLIVHDGKSLVAYDGRETAPTAANEKLFLDASGKPVPYYRGLIGGRSVGVPGVLRMLELAHREYGRLPWRSLFEPAIRLAEGGFRISPRLAKLVHEDPYLRQDSVAAAYFYDRQGIPWPVGHLLRNPELARVLRQVAEGGADAFYRGAVARDIAAKVQGHPDNPGLLTAEDIAAYRPRKRQALCSDYRIWRICGMPPPSSGGLAVEQMLGILSHTDIAAHPPRNGQLDPEAVHLFSEAGRLAFADRNRYVADPDFVSLPGGVLPLLDANYLAQRAALIGPRSMGKAVAGVPVRASRALADGVSPEMPSTSHLSVIDAQGTAVAMTTTVESAFGSRQMVDGFLLNNELTDFSYANADENGPVANRVQGGKRPRSSMAPTMVFERNDGKFLLSIGSPGGSYIINYVAKVLVGVLDWQLDLQQAINLPNFGSRNGPTELELGRVSNQLVDALKEKGHQVQLNEQTSGLQGIMRIRSADQNLWFGAADPRREGSVRGE
jgi:gamma-glutamyltranspeptidase/glutathione hydrolase